MTPEEFKTAGYQLIDWIADYLDGVHERPVLSPVAPGDVRAMLPLDPPTTPEPFGAVLADLDRVIMPGITHWQSPGFFAFFPSNTSYPSILGELASAGLGVNTMSWATSPAGTELETHVLDWMAELLGLPAAWRGNGVIQDSASSSALCTILAARDRARHAGASIDQLVGYATSQAHSSIEKGLRVAGIPAERFRKVAHDASFAMIPAALAEAIAADRAAGLVPFWVCASAGTTSSLAFDPIVPIATIARQEGLWLHVDAAMAGVATLCPEQRWINEGLDLVDSYCTNPHKWMGVNFDCSLLYVADRRPLLDALSIQPAYLRNAANEAGAVIDYRDWQVPLGRRFRALKLWFVLRCTGIEVIQAMIRQHVAWAAELGELVAADPRLELVAPVALGLVCLRATAGDDVTKAVGDAVNASGTAQVTPTVLEGRPAIRVSVGARLTTREHVVALYEQLSALAAR